jgi:hypothetical protein
MTKSQEILWQKIKNFELDDPAARFSFSDRLAIENQWTLEYALRVIEEYKKFMFLICISEQHLTPSDQVDQVWHLHLLYTQSYWIEFCEETIQRKIHHGPTKGGKSEHTKFEDWYTKTLEIYSQTFSVHAPDDIWPEQKIRFKEIHFARINTRKHWIIPKPSLFKK